ncbi:hypothetical protein [Saccharopolyspora sp. 5N708]|uniref:hypothetical protein n=1 Tax=Saccharopolyspora sp. 5N708 TaxID=3457424 RepID=UPI003FD2B741
MSELFREYMESTDVEGDVFRGATSEDRLAQFAAEGSPSQVLAEMLAAYSCGDGLEGARIGCELDGAVSKAVEDFAGPAAEVYERDILVKHGSGQLELMTLWVARKPDGASELVDSEGNRYSAGLDDFRQHNELLGADDQILAPRNITAVPGEGEIVAVSGHMTPRWVWIVGGIGIVVVVGGAAFLLLRLRRDRAFSKSLGD